VRCPHCSASESQVVDTRLSESRDAVRRRRRCLDCGRRFTTYERYDEGPLYLRKRDGSRQPFDRRKLLAGLERAAIKRPVERSQLEPVVDRIVAELRAEGGTPDADRVGELALRGLKELDRVAYVRFASVYRKFEDVAEFESELARLELEPPLQREHLFQPDPREQRDQDSPLAARSIRPGGHSLELPREPVAKGAKTGTAASEKPKENRMVKR
jgi:transcriptional repressor NrdR